MDDSDSGISLITSCSSSSLSNFGGNSTYSSPSYLTIRTSSSSMSSSGDERSAAGSRSSVASIPLSEVASSPVPASLTTGRDTRGMSTPPGGAGGHHHHQQQQSQQQQQHQQLQVNILMSNRQFASKAMHFEGSSEYMAWSTGWRIAGATHSFRTAPSVNHSDMFERDQSSYDITVHQSSSDTSSTATNLLPRTVE